MSDNIQFRVDAVLGDTTQLQTQLNNFRTNLTLTIDNVSALNAVQQVQDRVNALRSSMANMPMNAGAVGNINVGGGTISNIGNVTVQANQNLQMTQATIDNIRASISNINGQVDGTVSRLRLISDENGNITGGVATITNGYTTWTRELEQVRNAQGQVIQGQLQIANSGTTVVNSGQQATNMYNRQASLIRQIAQAETAQIGTTGAVNTAHQNKINFLKNELVALEQQDMAGNILTQEERQQLQLLRQKLNFDKQIKQAKHDQYQTSKNQSNMMTRLVQTMKQYLAYMVAMRIWTGIANAISDCVSYTRDLNTAMTNIRVVTMDTQKATEEMLDNYNEMGQRLGASTLDVAEGAVDWLNKIGLLYRNI